MKRSAFVTVGVESTESPPKCDLMKEERRLFTPPDYCETVASGSKTSLPGNHALMATYESGETAVAIRDAGILRALGTVSETGGIVDRTSGRLDLRPLPLFPQEDEEALGSYYGGEIRTAILDAEDLADEARIVLS